MCSSSVFSTHYLPIWFSEFLHGPHASFPLFTYLLMRGGQPRPYASPGAVPLCFPPTPYSSPASFWVFSQMLCWCPLMCTEWIYKAEECFCSCCLVLWLCWGEYISGKFDASCAGSVIRRCAKTPQVHSTQCPSIL